MESNVNEISGNSDLNPIFDIVNSIQNKLNENNTTNSNNTNEVQSNNVNKKDLSNLDISKMIEILNSNGTTNNNSNSVPNFGNLNLGNLMNFSNLLGSSNKVDPRTNLLNSLKPFLRETRQKNIDTYVTLLGVMQAINLFSGKDRD